MFFLSLGQVVQYSDAKMQTLELRSHFFEGIMLVTRAAPATLEPLLQKTLAEIDPGLTIVSVRSMRQQVEFSFDQDRAVASLASLFGTVALLLAAVGLYAVTAYAVAQRTREIGVRMALGAARRNVLQLVLRGAFSRVLAGLLLGLPLTVLAGRLIRTQLYGVTNWDPLALTVAASALALSAFLAAIIPAGRAAAIEPMEALRME
jgi:ABC-type antimicrobial peptide transport system permease subunit